MSDDPDSSTHKKSWLEKISHAFSNEPDSVDDLKQLLTSAAKHQIIDIDTLKRLEGALSVSEKYVYDVMIPRGQMVSLPINSSFIELMRQVVESGHSRFPVHGDDKDEIIGILLAKDLLRGVVIDNGPSDIHGLIRPAVLIPESKKLSVLLKEFRQSRNHMAIVIDEHGGVSGLITIEDVLEEIVGEIDDEHDDANESTMIAAQADGQFIVDALTPISEFNNQFGARFPDDEYDTIAGYIAAVIGHLPETGEEIALGRFHFQVSHADSRRIHRFNVSIHSD
ncbi:MAG TPA: transporter associated domain-containing protein [Arenimonas sp.]|nr:transporter associated domain-containing protein [Arenimonas sp.]